MATQGEGWRRRPIGPESAGRFPPSGSGPGAPTAPTTPSAPPETPASDGRTLLDPASAYLASLGPGSRRTMREALEKLAYWASDGRCTPHDLPWHLLQIDHTAALRTRLASHVAPATGNKHLAALRGVLRQCWQQGQMSAEAYHAAIHLPPLRGESPRLSTALQPEDFARMARCCADDPSPAGARDEALLALLRGANLRRAEAVALDVGDFDPGTGALRIRATNRRVETSPATRRALERWLAFRGRDAGPLLHPVNKGGRIERRRLSEQAIYIACQKRASEAGLPPTSPEDLRRSYAEP
jgi:integrase